MLNSYLKMYLLHVSRSIVELSDYYSMKILGEKLR